MFDSNRDRPEVQAFMLGFGLAWRAIGRVIPKTPDDTDRAIFDDTLALAREVFGAPFDPAPEPKKASRKGMKEPWEPGFFEEQSNTKPEAEGQQQ